MSDKIKYAVNKLVNRPFEYKGFKGVYVYKSLGLLASALFCCIISAMVLNNAFHKVVAIGIIVCVHLVLIVKNKLKSDHYNDLQRNRAKRSTPKKIQYRNRSIFFKTKPTSYENK